DERIDVGHFVREAGSVRLADGHVVAGDHFIGDRVRVDAEDDGNEEAIGAVGADFLAFADDPYIADESLVCTLLAVASDVPGAGGLDGEVRAEEYGVDEVVLVLEYAFAEDGDFVHDFEFVRVAGGFRFLGYIVHDLHTGVACDADVLGHGIGGVAAIVFDLPAAVEECFAFAGAEYDAVGVVVYHAGAVIDGYGLSEFADGGAVGAEDEHIFREADDLRGGGIEECEYLGAGVCVEAVVLGDPVSVDGVVGFAATGDDFVFVKNEYGSGAVILCCRVAEGVGGRIGGAVECEVRRADDGRRCEVFYPDGLYA